jgi:hypothetical protein
VVDIKRPAKMFFCWLALALFVFTGSDIFAAYLDWRKIGTSAAFSKIVFDKAPLALAITVGFLLSHLLAFIIRRVVRRQ